MNKTFFSFFVCSFSLFFYSNILFAQNGASNIVNCGVINAKVILPVKPELPITTNEFESRGIVEIQVTIDEVGNVISAKAISGEESLYKASIDAALASKFSPTFLDGKPVKVDGIILYNFNWGKTISNPVLNKKAVSLPKPKYPKEAKKFDAKGDVIVQVTIDEKGKVVAAKAVTGHILLRKASEENAFKAKFRPFLYNCIPTKVTGAVVYNFTTN